MSSEVGSRKSGVERCGQAATARLRAFPFPLSPFPFRRQALTLVELLVSIAIISILAALLLGVAAVATETARSARTKSLVARLHTLLIERYDGYRSQRVELKTVASVDSVALRAELTGPGGFVLPADIKPVAEGDPRVVAMARVAGLRETIKLEMPDRWSDLIGSAVSTTPTTIATSRSGLFLQKTPSLYSVYARAYNSLVGRTNTVSDQVNTKADIEEHQGAECLYLIIMNATGDGEARGLFKETDTADTDGDGAPEFVDGWGQPISFLRWAPGFESDAQLSFPALNRLASKQGNNAPAAAILADHDPYDLFQLDQPAAAVTSSGGYVNGRAWRLTPLVYSVGGDGESGLEESPQQVTALNPYTQVLSTASPAQSPAWFGSITNIDAISDNIDSHAVGALSRKR